MDNSELSIVELLLFRTFPFSWAAMAFAAASTLWLAITRFRGISHPSRNSPIRDLALLLTGPVAGILTSLSNSFYAAMLLASPNDFSGPPPTDYFRAAQTLAGVGMTLFAIGVVACLLPPKPNANVA